MLGSAWDLATTVASRRSSKSKADPDQTQSEDVVLLYRATPDGRGYDVLRKRGELLQMGVIRPLEEGKPISGEVVELVQRGDSPLFDVKVRFAADQPKKPPPALADVRGRPPRVASDDYRRNWDAIWKRPSGKALLN